MKDAGVNPEEITYINAHGTSTHHNDLFETRAIKLAFGEHAKDIRINSTKSMIGHLLGAAGAIECLTCVKEIEEGYIHATVGYETPDEELDLNYCKEAYEEEVPYAISNSLGFGGHNASCLLYTSHPVSFRQSDLPSDFHLPHRHPSLLCGGNQG